MPFNASLSLLIAPRSPFNAAVMLFYASSSPLGDSTFKALKSHINVVSFQLMHLRHPLMSLYRPLEEEEEEGEEEEEEL